VANYDKEFMDKIDFYKDKELMKNYKKILDKKNNKDELLPLSTFVKNNIANDGVLNPIMDDLFKAERDNYNLYDSARIKHNRKVIFGYLTPVFGLAGLGAYFNNPLLTLSSTAYAFNLVQFELFSYFENVKVLSDMKRVHYDCFNSLDIIKKERPDLFYQYVDKKINDLLKK
jgi:hypothetical protein